MGSSFAKGLHVPGTSSSILLSDRYGLYEVAHNIKLRTVFAWKFYPFYSYLHFIHILHTIRNLQYIPPYFLVTFVGELLIVDGTKLPSVYVKTWRLKRGSSRKAVSVWHSDGHSRVRFDIVKAREVYQPGFFSH